jgi:CRISPR-associated protein Cas2
MTARKLYLACYDVRAPRRLRKALLILKEFAGGGQYSCFECYLSGTEKQELMDRVGDLLHEEDAFILLPMNRAGAVTCLGTAVPAQDEEYYYLG